MAIDKQTAIDELRRRIGEIHARDAAQRAGLSVVEDDDGMDLRRVDTPFGPVSIAETTFAAGAFYGLARLSDLLETPREHLAHVFGLDDAGGLAPADSLSLDIETAGHPSGAGAFAFMIGLAYYEGRDFVLRQIFCASAEEEAASLWLFAEHAAARRFLFTYNGRGFDVPFLARRMRHFGMDPAFAFMPNLDVLLPARRVWKGAAADCRLTTLEREVLRVTRRRDIPSWQIPETYGEYVRQRNVRLLRSTFDHNLYDVATMPALAARMASAAFCPDPDEAGLSPIESAGIARLHLWRKDEAQAAPFLEHAARDGGDHGREARRQLALIFKRAKQPDRAARHWEAIVEAIESGAPFDGTAFIELARYHERTRKDPAAAREVVIRALAHCPPGNTRLRHELYERREKLSEKAAKSTPRPRAIPS
ncbi:ribonuclease H-like domain-containing protein [bacterium]|nr:ribonuclease H-like domain-containing protein [bacterium]